MQRSAARFLSDLEDGAARGLYFDPLAARNIVHFATTFCDLQLLPWQVFCLANIFGWKKPSGARRFTEAWVSTAKKNGKTRLASVVALWFLICDQEKYPDVFCAATKKEQSRLVWRDARRCVTGNPMLLAHVQRWAGVLAVKSTDGNLTPLSSDTKSMDGLRGSAILCDEVAMWDDRAHFDALVKGVVSRVQPLVFAITTAGKAKQCFAYGKFDLAEKILRRVINDDTTFVAIYALDKDDDPFNEACWPKSNPSLGVTLRLEHLQKIAEEAKQDPSGYNAWLQYHTNQWPEVNLSRAGSITAAKWDACAHRELIGKATPMENIVAFMELNRDTRCFLGVDIGQTDDMSAVSMLWPRARFVAGGPLVEKKVVVVTCFAPELGLLQKEKDWQVPLTTWVREGFLELHPGDLCDTGLIENFLLEARQKLKVYDIGFDRWQFKDQAARMSHRGITITEVPQLPSELTAPCRAFLLAIHRDELVHFGNPMLSWQAGNVILAESETTGGIKPAKLSRAEKIDGIQATINAFHRMAAAPQESVYASRGIKFI